jgi:selenocysteine lyase/cysteine desulfurase
VHEPSTSSVAATPAFPVDACRRRFPALAAAGSFVFFDNAAGAQIPDTVLTAVTDHLVARNVQRGGPSVARGT